LLLHGAVVASIRTATVVGVEARPVDVEIELAQGLPFFSIIGLGDAAVKEARYRVQAALRSAELHLPSKRITVNLAPAALRKDGASLDLPMAVGLLVAAGHLPPESVEGALIVGELSLSGHLRAVRGALSIAALAKASGRTKIIVPFDNGAEAASVAGIDVVASPTLEALVGHLKGESVLPPPSTEVTPAAYDDEACDFSEVRGQTLARRALEIAAVGGHNVLMVGNPGAGKTMLARRVGTILPPLSLTERIEVTQVHSAAGLTLRSGRLLDARPFRAPHHTVSEAGLIGGGHPIRPGEVSLAHHGVLFLDEMPELPRHVLESLRQPMEDREVVIARARQTVRLPASFMLVAAANPCPCGWLGSATGQCRCSSDEVSRYAGRISGALLDRIDLIVETPAIDPEALMTDEASEPSSAIRERVAAARERGGERQGINARLSGRQLRREAPLTRSARTLMKTCMAQLSLSARGWERGLRVARSIADLDGAERIDENHVAEAMRYRRPSTWLAPTTMRAMV
jgi:magnesium chelatase family protein